MGKTKGGASGMATPGQLVTCIASALGVSRATVALHDRNLSEAGLRSKGGRGKSAVKVSAIDAVHLLIATIAAPIIPGSATSNSAAVCRFFHQLRAMGRRGSLSRWPSTALPQLARLPRGHSLIDCLMALIDSVREGEFHERKFNDPSDWYDSSLLRVTFNSPLPFVDVWLSSDSRRNQISYDAFLEQETPFSKVVFGKTFIIGDLHQQHSISGATVLRIGELLTHHSAERGQKYK